MKKAQKRAKIVTAKGLERKNNREINKVFRKIFNRYNVEKFKTN